MPAALEDSGGWANRESAGWFADYSRLVFRALGDRVPFWSTINEPAVIAHAGYVTGVHAPGHRDLAEASAVSHNLLRAHGMAVRAARSEGVKQIGIVVNLIPKEPASSNSEDRAAAERSDIYVNRHYLDPVLKGCYPKELPGLYGRCWGEKPAKDHKVIAEKIDFLGVNYYTREIVQADDNGLPDRASVVRKPDQLYTETGWEVFPDGLTRILLRVKQRYGNITLYLTENGAAFPDPPRAYGDRVHDPLRVEYIRHHVAAAAEAIRLGVHLRGYFAWSLLDNMEWACGYTKRFGLVHVDFDTQKRTLKESAVHYRDLIAKNGEAG
jgi:beta-glucosidase